MSYFSSTSPFTTFNSNADIIREYRANSNALDGANVLIAWYHCPPYEGYSFVLFEKDGKLYEVNGSHCSCNGLEGQWIPEETSWAALAMRKRRYPETDIDSQTLLNLIKAHV